MQCCAFILTHCTLLLWTSCESTYSAVEIAAVRSFCRCMNGGFWLRRTVRCRRLLGRYFRFCLLSTVERFQPLSRYQLRYLSFTMSCFTASSIHPSPCFRSPSTNHVWVNACVWLWQGSHRCDRLRVVRTGVSAFKTCENPRGLKLKCVNRRF